MFIAKPNANENRGNLFASPLRKRKREKSIGTSAEQSLHEIFFSSHEMSHEKCSEIFPKIFQPLFCVSQKLNPEKLPPNFPQNFPPKFRKKFTDERREKIFICNHFGADGICTVAPPHHPNKWADSHVAREPAYKPQAHCPKREAIASLCQICWAMLVSHYWHQCHSSEWCVSIWDHKLSHDSALSCTTGKSSLASGGVACKVVSETLDNPQTEKKINALWLRNGKAA